MERLAVALVIDSTFLPAWMARVVGLLSTANFVELTTVIINERSESNPDAPWFFKVYEKLDLLLFRPAEDPLARLDVSKCLAGIDRISLSDLRSPEATVATRFHWDVVIWLSHGEMPGSLDGYSRHGVWFFRHSGSEDPQRSAEYFWEIYAQKATSRVDLLIRSTNPANIHLASSAVSSTEFGWSISKNRHVPYSRAAGLLLAELRRLGNQDQQVRAATLHESAEHKGFPTGTQMARFLLQNARRTASLRLKYSHQERHWFIAYRTESSRFITQTAQFEPDGFTEFEAAPGHFYADPFVVDRGGRSYIFFEDYPYREKKGVISVVELETNGSLGAVERVLERPYHLSYPFTFEHEGEFYMIPETLANRSIELYRALDFPRRWELACVLKQNIDAVDTTLWIDEKTFYFFTSIAEGGATVNDDLFLFHSRSLSGEWTSHPANPICTDVRRSRSAGKLFRRAGKLIRPGQDCSVRYGYACQLNEVEELSTMRYRERPIERIEPDWQPNLIGTHTINTGGRVEVIDGQVYRPKALVRN